jgi:hypothetical protein
MVVAQVIGEEETVELLRMPWEAGDLVPLVVFLDRLGSRSKAARAKLSDLPKTLDMIRFLAQPLHKEFNLTKIRVRA